MLFQSNGTCPICQTAGAIWCETQDWEYRSSPDWYTYFQCPACRTLFIKEVPQRNLLDIYPANYYSFSQKSGRLIFKLKNLLDRKFYQSILKELSKDSLSVLDVGGGTGEVLDVLLGADKRITYTEIVDIDSGSKFAAEKKNHRYTLSTIETYTTERKFDIILLLNIIEHVGDPLSIIHKCEKLLAKDGLIIIKTPNADSMDARLFRKRYWGGLHCPRHWIIFTDTSFKTMLNLSGSRIKKISFTQGAPFWVYSLLHLFSNKDIQKNKKPLIDHSLFGLLSILFALFDFFRLSFSKTSQMFIILKTR